MGNSRKLLDKMCTERSKKKILVLCTHNSARSQIAEGLLRKLGQDKFEVESAGTEPGQINPCVMKVLAEVGIDATRQYSKSVAQFVNGKFDYVITVCSNAGKSCPTFIGKYNKIHWPLPDPSAVGVGESRELEAFRITRDELKVLILNFLSNH